MQEHQPSLPNIPLDRQPIRTLRIPPMNVPETNTICIILEHHGVRVEKGPVNWELEFPAGTTIFLTNLTVQHHYKIDFPDGWYLAMTRTRDDVNYISIPTSSINIRATK